MRRIRFALSTPSGLRALDEGEYFLGRSSECDIVLASSRASRRHAKLVVTEDRATIEDLGSANGVFVNGARLAAKPQRLAHDDFLVVGDLALEVIIEEVLADAPRVAPRPVSARPPALPSGHMATSRAHALELLAAVADRALTSGHPERAERTLDEWLLTTLQAARTGRPSEPRLNDLAFRYSLELAVALRASRWTDYALQLVTALGQTLDAERASRLEKALDCAGVQPGCLDTYAAKLRSLPPSEVRDATLGAVQRWRAMSRR